jgi:hypothetical protein
MNTDLKQKIYKYIDKNGIPIKRIATVSVTYKPNIYEEIYLTDTFEQNLNSPDFSVLPELPFDISDTQMSQVVTDYIFDTTGVRIEHIGQILSNPYLNGIPFLLLLNEHGTKQKISLAKKVIPGSLILRDKYSNYGFDSLGNIEVIRGDFGISDSLVKNLGNLRKIYKDFWITSYVNQLQLQSLFPLKEVGGNVSIKDLNLKSLDTLEFVKGNITIRQSNIKDLGNLKFVGGNFLARKEHFENYDFSNIEIKGKIKLYKI